MNQDLISPILLGVAIGLMLAFVPPRIMWIALALFLCSAVLGMVVPLRVSLELTISAVRISAIAAALLIYAPRKVRVAASLPVCVCAGFWLGSSAAQSGDFAMLALGLGSTLIAFCARWIPQSLVGIAFKVVASWIIAIALLSLGVSLVSTPGYEPDHME